MKAQETLKNGENFFHENFPVFRFLLNTSPDINDFGWSNYTPFGRLSYYDSPNNVNFVWRYEYRENNVAFLSFGAYICVEETIKEKYLFFFTRNKKITYSMAVEDLPEDKDISQYYLEVIENVFDDIIKKAAVAEFNYRKGQESEDAKRSSKRQNEIDRILGIAESQLTAKPEER